MREPIDGNGTWYTRTQDDPVKWAARLAKNRAWNKRNKAWKKKYNAKWRKENPEYQREYAAR